MNQITPALVAVVTAIIGLATVAVIVGSSQTSNVISQSGSALATVIKAAVSPVAGGGSIFGSAGSSALGSLAGGIPGQQAGAGGGLF